MRQASRQIEGVVVSVHCHQTRRKGLWSHRFKIGCHEYSLLANDSVPLFRPGDMVRLRWVSYQGKWRAYRNIVGDPELIRPREESERADGYIYVLTNASMPDLVKIGMTTRSPEERCIELSQATSVPTPFRLEWSLVVVGNVSLVESLVHQSLSLARSGKEFFRLHPEQARDAILEVYFSLYPEQRGTLNSLEVRQRAYEQERARARTLQHAQEEEQRRRDEAIRLAKAATSAPQTHSQTVGTHRSQLQPPSSAGREINPAVLEVMGAIVSIAIMIGLTLLMRACALGPW